MFHSLTAKIIRKITFAIYSIMSLSNVTVAESFSSKSLEEILELEYTGEVPKESSQYDFFIGEWDVVVKEHDKDGKVIDSAVGVWWAKYLHNKRVVFDDVVFSDGKGKIQPGYPSLRTYSPKLEKWVSMHMAPLSTQALCSNIGTSIDGEMHINAVCRKSDGTIQDYSRIRFYNITYNSWDYTWESSQDNKNWRLFYTFEAKRRKVISL